MSHELHKRLFALECRTDQVGTIKHENERLRSALAEICTGQQAQDEVICDLQRRVEELEALQRIRDEE